LTPQQKPIPFVNAFQILDALLVTTCWPVSAIADSADQVMI